MGLPPNSLKRWVSLHSQFLAEWRSSNVVSEVDVILKLYGFNGNFDVDRLMPGAPSLPGVQSRRAGQPSQKVNVGQQESNQKVGSKEVWTHPISNNNPESFKSLEADPPGN